MDEFALCKCMKVGFCTETNSCGLYPKRLKDGTLLYTQANYYKCPVYKNSTYENCGLSLGEPSKIVPTNDGDKIATCMRCVKIHEQLNAAKNPPKKTPEEIKAETDKFYTEGGRIEI
jgi:Zn-finger protein